jgi:hypothetical protein
MLKPGYVLQEDIISTSGQLLPGRHRTLGAHGPGPCNGRPPRATSTQS